MEEAQKELSLRTDLKALRLEKNIPLILVGVLTAQGLSRSSAFLFIKGQKVIRNKAQRRFYIVLLLSAEKNPYYCRSFRLISSLPFQYKMMTQQVVFITFRGLWFYLFILLGKSNWQFFSVLSSLLLNCNLIYDADFVISLLHPNCITQDIPTTFLLDDT